MKTSIRTSIGGLIIFGSFPAFLMFLAIVTGARHGFSAFMELAPIAGAMLAFVFVWNRGLRIDISADTLTYRKFFVLRETIPLSEISKSVAIAKADLSVGRPLYRVEIYDKGKLAMVINLKPFPREGVEQLFEHLPKLDRSKFGYNLAERKHKI